MLPKPASIPIFGVGKNKIPGKTLIEITLAGSIFVEVEPSSTFPVIEYIQN